MTEQELEKFYDGLEKLYEYYEDYSLQDVYNSLVSSGLFDLSSKEDLDFVESFAYKIYFGAQDYKNSKISFSDMGNALKSLADAMGHKEKVIEYKPEYDFSGKTVKEVLDELSNEWKERIQ